MLTPQGSTGWVPLDALPCGRSPDRNVSRPVVRHQVQPGEVLGTIARDYRVRIDEIIAHNGLSGDLIRVGQWLEIPGGLPGPRQETLPKASSDPAGLEADSNTPWVWHTVQPGESYWSISTQYPQATMESLLRMNDIAPEALRPGMKVRIPPP
jgi:membrane-bound lytic murein transglycosylase D